MMGYENTDSSKLRTMIAMELAAPIYNSAGDTARVPIGQGPRTVKQAIEIMRETLDQASHPSHPLYGDGVCDDIKTRIESFSRRMPLIERVWNRKHPVFGVAE